MNETEKLPCISCRIPQSPKASHECGICNERVCRSCAIFLDETTFAFRSELAPELKHSYYCAPCHDTHVQPELDRYEALLETARGVYFFFGISRHPLPVLRKADREVRVADCADRDETILRLGYQAAEAGYNAIILGEVTPSKVRNHGWQKSSWSGHGLPALVDAEKLERDAQMRILKGR